MECSSGAINVPDSVSLFHLCRTPALEVAVMHVEQCCMAEELMTVDYYQDNEHLKD